MHVTPNLSLVILCSNQAWTQLWIAPTSTSCSSAWPQTPNISFQQDSGKNGTMVQKPSTWRTWLQHTNIHSRKTSHLQKRNQKCNYSFHNFHFLWCCSLRQATHPGHKLTFMLHSRLPVTLQRSKLISRKLTSIKEWTVVGLKSIKEWEII